MDFLLPFSEKTMYHHGLLQPLGEEKEKELRS